MNLTLEIAAGVVLGLCLWNVVPDLLTVLFSDVTWEQTVRALFILMCCAFLAAAAVLGYFALDENAPLISPLSLAALILGAISLGGLSGALKKSH